MGLTMNTGQKTIAGLLVVVAILLTLNLSLDANGQRRRQPPTVPRMPTRPLPDPMMPAPHVVEEHQHEALREIAAEIRLLRNSVENLGPRITASRR